MVFVISKESETICTYSIRVYGCIEDIEDYKELFSILQKASKRDRINIHLSSNGGCCRIGSEIVNAIRSSEAHVHIIVTYPTMSMGATIALSGDSLELRKHTYLMFHTYSAGIEGKSNELAGRTENFGQYFRNQFKDVCCPFLTTEECSQMFDGKDLYIGAEDKNLKERIKRHFKEAK